MNLGRAARSAARLDTVAENREIFSEELSRKRQERQVRRQVDDGDGR
jgi:hypothetical protein